MTSIDPLSLEGLITYSLKDRPSKVSQEDFARPWTGGGVSGSFWRVCPIFWPVRP